MCDFNTVVLYKYDLSNGIVRAAANTSLVITDLASVLDKIGIVSKGSRVASRSAALVADAARNAYRESNRDLGIWHTSIVVFETEYTYNDTGISIKYSLDSPNEQINLGLTTKTEEELGRFIRTLRTEFSQASYHALKRNCNDFSNELTQFLLNKDIRLTLSII